MQGHRSDADIGRDQTAARSTENDRPQDRQEYARLLRQVDLFAGVERVTLAKLAAHLRPLFYPPSSIIVRQADVDDALYLVARGSVGVYATARDGTTETRVNVLHAGEPFGEMALLSNRPRTATIKAETECEVLRLDRSAFLNLVQEQPSVALAIAATLGGRLAGMLDQADGTDAAASVGAPMPVSEAIPAVAVQRPRRSLGRTAIALIAAIIILALGSLLSPPLGLSLAAWRALFILLAALPALMLDALLEGVLGLLLAGAWVLFGVTSPEIALAGFASPNWVLVVAVLIIGAAIAATGLLYRLALEIITHIRGGFAGEMTALSLAGLLMGPAVPNATSRVIIIAPMLTELVEALGYRPQSKGAAGLAMAILIGFGQMTAMFLTSSTTAVLVSAVLPSQARADIDWISWALYGAPINIILFVGVLVSLLWLYWPTAPDHEAKNARATSLALQRALLGPMSRAEKIALGTGIALLAGFMTQSLHGVNPAWVAVLAAGVLAATRVVTIDTLRAVNWNFALLFGVLISFAIVFEHTGLDRWVADRAAGAANILPSTHLAFVIALTFICIAISFVVRWQAAAPLITIALAPVASAAGIHPFVVGVIAVVACSGFYLPYQSTSYLALYSGTGGELFSHNQALPAALAYGVWTVVAVALSVPAWRWMGLL